MSEKIFIFDNENCDNVLMLDKERSASFKSIVDAVKHLMILGVDEESILNYHYSYENGFASIPCSIWTILQAKKEMAGQNKQFID